MKTSVFLILIILSVVYSQKSGKYSRVIYGTDDRLDYFEVNSSLQSFGESSVIILYGTNIVTSNSDGTFTATSTATAEDFWNYCPEERYSQQLILSNANSFCSGFLLSNDPPWIGTAAHCTEGSTDNVLIIFGFEVISSGTTRLTFAADDVYSVNRVVVQGSPSGAVGDYGIYELDRPVVGYTPYTQVNNNLSVDDSLTIIGHPNGLPKKFDSGGEVTELRTNLIIGTVDSYGGNSGSPIFDANNNLVGILVGGAPDFEYGSCDVSNVCPGGNGCTGGENIVPICDLLLSTTEIENQLGLCGATPSTPTTTPTAAVSVSNAPASVTSTPNPVVSVSNAPASVTSTPNPAASNSQTRTANAAASNSRTRTPSVFSFSTQDDDDLFTSFSTNIFSTITSFFSTVSSNDDDDNNTFTSFSINDDDNNNNNDDDNNDDDDQSSSNGTLMATYSSLLLSIVFFIY